MLEINQLEALRDAHQSLLSLRDKMLPEERAAAGPDLAERVEDTDYLLEHAILKVARLIDDGTGRPHRSAGTPMPTDREKLPQRDV